MSKIAIIDCGTNTFHLLVVEIIGSTYKSIHQEKRVVKIGQGGINYKLITSEAEHRALEALRHFKTKIDEYGKPLITHAFATSAFRNASNGSEIRDKIKVETGIDLRIINGETEAELIYRGVNSAMNLGTEMVLVMDIGGGSVEFIIAQDQTILWKGSFEIGAQRLLDLFHKHDPILESEIIQLEDYLQTKLNDLILAINEWRPTTLVGASGTFDTLSSVYCQTRSISVSDHQSETPLSISDYHKIHDELITFNRLERMRMPGMIEMRVDMIVVASCIIKFLLRRVSINKIRVSRYALKEGALAQIVEGLRLD